MCWKKQFEKWSQHIEAHRRGGSVLSGFVTEFEPENMIKPDLYLQSPSWKTHTHSCNLKS